MAHAAFQNNTLNLLPRKEVSLTGEFLRLIENGAIAPACSDPCFWNALQTVLIVRVVFGSPDFDILRFETTDLFSTILSASRSPFSAASANYNRKC